MQRIIQINIAGRIIPIEEDAYRLLGDYLSALERQFEGEEGRDEIIRDIEHRIAELFTFRLEAGAPAIATPDISKLIETLGPPQDIAGNASAPNPAIPVKYTGRSRRHHRGSRPGRRLYRDPERKMLGGVCGGIGNYFDVDPVLIRLIFGVSAIFAFAGVLVYLVAWAVVPLARTPEQKAEMQNGDPVSFGSIARNMGEELEDLKKRAERMSRDLKSYFSRKG